VTRRSAPLYPLALSRRVTPDSVLTFLGSDPKLLRRDLIGTYGMGAVPLSFTLEGVVVNPFGMVYIPDKTDDSLSQPTIGQTTIGRSKLPPTACSLLLWMAFLFTLTRPVLGQDYTIQTEVGRGWILPGISANLPLTQGVAIDGSGNVFIVLTDDSVVVRMDPSGQLTLLAGNGIPGFSGDGGPAALAQLFYPTAAATDAAGNVYILDNGNHRIREVSNGVINTVAGGGSSFIVADNSPATSADLSGLIPYGLAVDSAGSFYFTAGNILKVSNGVITTVAGGGFGLGDNVPATSAFAAPAGLAIDAAGNLYYADTCYNRIRRVSNGIVSTVAGNGKPVPALLGFRCATSVAGPDTGTATSVTLNGPQGVAVDPAGNVYFMESAPSFGGRARQVSKGIITTVAGGNPSVLGMALGDNIPATSAVLYLAAGIAVDTAGNLYIPDNYGPFEIGRLRQVSNGVITTIAGASGVSGDNGPATGAQLSFPTSVAVDTQGSLYIVDSSNNVVRKILNGAITTIAGNRSDFHDSGSGPASSISLNGPEGVAVDSAGNVYIADPGNTRIVELSGGAFTTVATGVFATSIALDAGGIYTSPIVAATASAKCLMERSAPSLEAQEQASAATTVRPPAPNYPAPLVSPWIPRETFTSRTRITSASARSPKASSRRWRATGLLGSAGTMVPPPTLS